MIDFSIAENASAGVIAPSIFDSSIIEVPSG
jgi:hypothetical protein